MCEASMLDEVLAFLHKMRANSCIPNVVTYNTLLGGFLKVGQRTRWRKLSLRWCPKVVVEMEHTKGVLVENALENYMENHPIEMGIFNVRRGLSYMQIIMVRLSQDQKLVRIPRCPSSQSLQAGSLQIFLIRCLRLVIPTRQSFHILLLLVTPIIL